MSELIDDDLREKLSKTMKRIVLIMDESKERGDPLLEEELIKLIQKEFKELRGRHGGKE